MKSDLVKQHFSKADTAFTHANEYFERGKKELAYNEDCVEMLSKAIHQAANGAFVAKGLTPPKTPRGTTVMLYEHFISEGLLDKRFGRLATKVHEAKDEAFYGLMIMDRKKLQSWLEETRKFIGNMKSLAEKLSTKAS